MGATALNKKTKRGRVEGSVRAMTEFNAKRKEIELERFEKARVLIESGKTNKEISEELGVASTTAGRYRKNYENEFRDAILLRVQNAAGDPTRIEFIKETRPDIAFYLTKGIDFILSDDNITNIVVSYFR